jgi:hypothetical protein
MTVIVVALIRLIKIGDTLAHASGCPWRQAYRLAANLFVRLDNQSVIVDAQNRTLLAFFFRGPPKECKAQPAGA